MQAMYLHSGNYLILRDTNISSEAEIFLDDE
jgi:hypothetical protein